MHDYNENDTHVIHLYNSKPMPPKQSWRMPLSSSSSYSSCHDYIMLLSVSIFDFASWYDNQSSVTLLQKRFYTLSEVRQSRVAPWCGKGKNWKDVWLTGDLRVFDYVLLTDINIPFGISSCKHRFGNNLNISLYVWRYYFLLPIIPTIHLCKYIRQRIPWNVIAFL